MANPVFNSQNFNEQMHSGGGDVQTAPQNATPEQLDAMYNSPSANSADMGRMTYNDVISRTTILLGIVLVGAAISWFAQNPLFTFGGAVVGLVLGLVNAFKREPSVPLIMIYGAAEGLFLGGLSFMFNSQWEGIVGQAILGTLCVFAVTLALFMSGKVRATAKANKIFLIAMVSYGVFSLLNLVLMITGVTDAMFGLRSGILGVVIGLLAILMASYALVMDFTSISEGVKAGAPRRYAWSAAFGLTVTLIWLYTEILRLLAILRDN